MIDINQKNLNSLPQQVEENRLNIESLLMRQGTSPLTLKCADAELQCALNTYNITKVVPPPPPKKHAAFIKRGYRAFPGVPISIGDLLAQLGFSQLPDTTLFFANILWNKEPISYIKGRFDKTLITPSPIFFVKRSTSFYASIFDKSGYCAYKATYNSTLGGLDMEEGYTGIEVYAIGGYAL